MFLNDRALYIENPKDHSFPSPPNTHITSELDIVMQKLKKNNLSSQGLSQDPRLHLKKRKGGERREGREGREGREDREGRERAEQSEAQRDTNVRIDTQTKRRKDQE